MESDVTSQDFGNFSSKNMNFEGKNTVTLPVLPFFISSRLSTIWLFGVIRSASSRPYWSIAKTAMLCVVAAVRVNCLSASLIVSANLPPPGITTI